MKLTSTVEGREAAITDLVAATFATSDGPEEGALIEGLVGQLLSDPMGEELFVFVADDADTLVGAIFFTRLRYSDDDRSVFVLGPVAVSTDRQAQGIGQLLIRHGLTALSDAGVDVVLVYGDPNYYSRVGFVPITEGVAAAPYPLRHPHGWQAQSLSDAPLMPLKGTATPVPAFRDAAFW